MKEARKRLKRKYLVYIDDIYIYLAYHCNLYIEYIHKFQWEKSVEQEKYRGKINTQCKSNDKPSP